jgi:hypothetical protein
MKSNIWRRKEITILAEVSRIENKNQRKSMKSKVL